MFHKAINLTFKEKTVLEVTFQTGEVKSFDMSKMFDKYPQLEALKDRDLFLSGKLIGGYGIVWTDELDFEAESIYDLGTTVRTDAISYSMLIGNALYEARESAGLSQSELAVMTGIDQSDISKIERGKANPSIATLGRLGDAMGMKINFMYMHPDKDIA